MLRIVETPTFLVVNLVCVDFSKDQCRVSYILTEMLVVVIIMLTSALTTAMLVLRHVD